ncbi:hypothetical protein GWA01_09270 [Gluconobacter wancherniae NBRC 103581]|uniref:Uncharacterized protein n=2 Tax=Gluconobacter wancherniae TaxID=1307955 RepID=A0A511B5S8_9PROT|nr:hypothetical protein AA103581_2040 [Gluconobacter wancherniae NBRC 103581]GEK93157.1 hypothetical protein GWA01_09270 [Gluconobacter wancherniae NBRC 103581]
MEKVMKNTEERHIIRHCIAQTHHWLVEQIRGEDIESATFHGPDAEQRAKEYAAWRYDGPPA